MSALGIDATLNALLSCVCEALEASGVPVCICSTTIGEPVSPLSMAIAECSCGGSSSGEAWGALQQVYPVDRQTLGQAQVARRPCAGGQWGARYIITVIRCFPSIDENGDLASPEEQAASAAELHADAAAIHRAIVCCADVEEVLVETIGVIIDPEAGTSRLTASVVAAVSLAARDNPR